MDRIPISPKPDPRTGPIPETPPGPEASPGPEAVPAGLEQALATELDRWRTAEPGTTGSGFGLAYLVAALARCTGRHHLGEPLLTALAEVADRHRGHDPYLDAFLDAVLARRRQAFRNQTYLALPLLALILADERSGLDPVRLSALLLADLVRHEQLPEAKARIDAVTRGKRTRHAARFITAIEPTLGTVLPTPPGTEAGDWLPLTALPVSLVHDEYFFIRALQAHELVFTTITAEVRAATEAARAGDALAAAAAVDRATAVLGRGMTLFRVVATMRVADFRDFRRHTEGASAIQSEAYKRFELACGTPTPERLASEAFAAVPGVRPAADTLADAHAALPADAGGVAELRAAMSRLEAHHQRWKTAHHALAARMLGDAPGSGYTSGVPYLRGNLDNRLFPDPADPAADVA